MGNTLATLWKGIERDAQQVASALQKLDCGMTGAVHVTDEARH